jgi:hypothetical protein
MSLFPTIGELKTMPRAPKGKMLDSRGREMSFFLYPSPRWNLKSYSRRYWLSADTKTNVGPYDRWELVNYSRQLYAQVDNLSAAIDQKNSWAFASYAWDAEFAGRNKKWGERSAEWLKHVFYPNANVRGGVFDFKTSLAMSGRMWDVDGDDAMMMVRGSIPQLAFYPSTRIGATQYHTTGAEKKTIEGGKYNGAQLFDGCVLDRNNRLLAVALQSSDNDDIIYVPAFNCDLAFEPKWSDQGRGIPRIATSLLRWMDMQDLNAFLTKGVKRAATQMLQEFTETGEPKDATLEDEEGNSISSNPVDTEKHKYYEEIDGGEMRIYKANSGEKLEGIQFENPHENTENFIKRLERGSIASIGWFYELLNLSESGRAATRLMCDLANQSIWDKQYAGNRRALRAVNYALSDAMESGALPRNEENGGLDAYLWHFGSPKEISVDAGNDQTAAQNRLRMGMTSLTIEAQKAGFRQQQIRDQRRDERFQQIDDAAALVEYAKKKGIDLPAPRALDMQEMDYPNGAPAQPQPQQKKNEPPKNPAA